MKNHYSNKKKNILSTVPWMTLGFLALVVLFSKGLTSVEETNEEQQFKSLEQAIVRSAVHCYAVEGAYPSDLKYLEENYQLEIDKDTYIVHYEVMASNIVPDITVIARNK